ncbi:MAG: hypothetical protein ACYCX6_00130 [Vulcanimicrobiaceae bacterium]
MMGRPGRPASLGFTAAQAARFRRLFRNQRALVGASNRDIGRAINKFRIAGKADGLTVLQNALSPARKLTHRAARIIVAGLFLGDSVRTTGFFEIKRRQFALSTLGGALYGDRAWDPHPAIPAFIPLDAVDSLAARLADGRPALRKILSQRLRAEAPAMGRAWCERVRRTPIAGTTPRILEFIQRIEGLVRAEFSVSNVEPPELMFSLGPEFGILHRERPDLTQDFLHELARAHHIDARSNP